MSKVVRKREVGEENRVKNIPPESPLGRMLELWESDDKTRDLSTIKMIHYCVEVWPTLDLMNQWPWCGTRDLWMCTQLYQYLKSQENTSAEQIRYAVCWQDSTSREEATKICKLKEQEKVEERKEKREKNKQ